LAGAVPTPDQLATDLARAHAGPVGALAVGPLLVDVAESSRAGDWSLRSALVRFAQPEPTRAGAVLELVRRTDGALKPHRRRLESTLVPTHPDLDGSGELVAGRADARAADLARALARLPEGEAVVASYAAAQGLDEPELAAVRLLAVAVELDAIADALVGWALTHAGPPPIAVVEHHGARAHTRLEALGVPREEGPPRGARSSRG
jgi:hypothetical protein